MKIALMALFLSVSSLACVHSSDLRSDDPYGSEGSSTSANPFHNGSSTETFRISQMQSCLNRVGHTVEAEEWCAQSVRRSMPGAYIVTRDWTVVPSN